MDSAKLPRIVKDSVSCIWTIDDFKNKYDTAISQKMVTTKNKDRQFVMYLDARNRLFGLENVLLALYYYPHESQLLIRYRVSILDWNFEKQYTKEYRWDYRSSHKSNYNVTSLISLEECKKYLLDEIEAFGALKLQIGIDVYYPENECCNFDAFLPPEIPENPEAFDFTPFLENSQLTDVTLIVGEQHFRAHKVILAAQSDTFRSMFCECGCEKSVYKGGGDQGINSQVMEQMLNFIYTGKIAEIGGKFALELYYAADKFCLEDLKTLCENKITTQPLNIESVSGVLLFAEANNREQLKAKCIEYIVEHSEKILLTEGWKQLALSNQIELMAELFGAMSFQSRNSRKILNEVLF